MLHRMHSVVLTHQPDSQYTAPDPAEVSIHMHPYASLPWVTSHIDPKLVILETGRKLSLIPYIYLSDDDWFKSRPVLRKICDIFVSWTSAIPSSAFTHCPDYYTPDIDCTEKTVQDITNSHGRWPTFSLAVKRKRSEELKKLAAARGYAGHPVHLPKLPLPEGNDSWTTTKISSWSNDVRALTQPLDMSDPSSVPLGVDERSYATLLPADQNNLNNNR